MSSLVWAKLDWASNASYPWHGMSSIRNTFIGHVSVQSREWVVLFDIQATDPNTSIFHEWLAWSTATSDASGNLTLAPLQIADLSSYGASLLSFVQPTNPGANNWQSTASALPAIPGLQHPSVDVVLYSTNITNVSDPAASAIFDAFLPLNVDLMTGAVTANPITSIDTIAFYFLESFFFTQFWKAPEYFSHGNTKIRVMSSVVSGSAGRVNAVAGTCSSVHTFSNNFYQNIGAPGNPIFIDPTGNQYAQMPFTSNDLLFSSLTTNASPVNMQNNLLLPSTFPAAFGSGHGQSGSTLFWNDPNFPFSTIHGGNFTGYVSNASNPGAWNEGATSWSIPAGVAPPPGGSSIPMMTRAPDNDIIPGEICILGCTGGTSTNPGTSTEVYRLGQSGPDWSPFLISHTTYPAMDANLRAGVNTGFSDLSGNPVWIFFDSSVGGFGNSDWYLWAGATAGGAKWSIGSVLLG